MTEQKCCLEYSRRKIKISGSCASCLGVFRDGDILNASDLIPDGMCAFLYQSCLPYLLTLVGNGWLKWSLDKNSVDTQCCCSGGVQVAVRKVNSAGQLTVRAQVVSAGPACLKHKVGAQFILYPWGKNSCPHLFHSLFPRILSASENIGDKETLCVSPLAGLRAGVITESDSAKARDVKVKTYDSVTVKSFSNSCIYFRKTGKIFTLGQLTPDGISPESFYRVYPYFLAALYDGVNSDEVYFPSIRCVGNNGDFFWRLTPENYLLKLFLNLVEFGLRKVKRPQDVVDKKITLTPVTGSGDSSVLPGAAKSFTHSHYSNYLLDRNFCPAVFYQIYPVLFANLGNAGELICPSVVSGICLKLGKTTGPETC